MVVGGWSFAVSSALLLALDRTMGLRVSDDTELRGLDMSEHGESVDPLYRAAKSALLGELHEYAPPPPCPPARVP